MKTSNMNVNLNHQTLLKYNVFHFLAENLPPLTYSVFYEIQFTANTPRSKVSAPLASEKILGINHTR